MVGVGEMFRAPGAVACCEGVAKAKDSQSFRYWRGHFVCCVSWKRGNGQKFCPSERRLTCLRLLISIVKSRVLARIT